MTYTGLKMIEVELQGEQHVFFPEVQALKGKKIITINAISGVSAYRSVHSQVDYKKLFINIVDRNGIYHHYQDLSVNSIDIDVCKGININIDRELKIEGCYLSNPEKQSGYAIFVVAYEISGYSRIPNADIQKIAALEIPILYPNRPNKFPDNRTLFDVSLIGFNYSESLISPANNDCYNISSDEFKGMYLTLTKGIYRIFDTIPLKYFVQSQWYEKMSFDNIVFNCDNSFVEFGQLTGNFTSKMLNFNVEYKS